MIQALSESDLAQVEKALAKNPRALAVLKEQSRGCFGLVVAGQGSLGTHAWTDKDGMPFVYSNLKAAKKRVQKLNEEEGTDVKWTLGWWMQDDFFESLDQGLPFLFGKELGFQFPGCPRK